MPLELTDIELGWLAGTLDGEGAVGLAKNIRNTLRPIVQMSTTDETTARCVVSMLERLGLRGVAYEYQEKKPERHRNCWNIRVGRIGDLAALAAILGPISVTKHEQWFLLRKFAESRLVGARFDESGRLIRGGSTRPYTAAERAMYDQMRTLNARGPR